ncbi:unnamed protein product [Diplocarpon coronariae]|uniref:Uncharacterized protein n=1 Tax=Diplocarpon coronariae TaxID=2795749 RepID=A0A218ZBH6_9HELO|nr:hypothetical protein B2J93_8305 [Marssonina coronariae]
MHFASTLAVLVSGFVAGGLSCQEGYQTYCQWRGTAPVCGNSGYSLGQRVGDEYMHNWTRDIGIDEQYRRGQVTYACYEEYGETCWKGYKELWCRSTPYLTEKVDAADVRPAARPKHPHQKEIVKIEIGLDTDLK